MEKSKSTTATRLRVDFTDILRTLSTGPVEITKHGKVVAILTAPPEEAPSMWPNIDVQSPVESASEAPESTVEASAPTDTQEAPEAQETPLAAPDVDSQENPLKRFVISDDNDDIESVPGLDGDLSDSDGDTDGSEDRASEEDWRIAVLAARDRLAVKRASATQ